MDCDEDRLLPIANVGRIMKQVLPPSAKISKEAKERMQECATEFVSFVTAEASDKCRKENRKTVNGDDICWALSALGFDDYAEVIVRYLHKCREAEREKANKNKPTDHHNSQDKDEEYSNIDGRGQPNLQPIETPTPLEFTVLEKGNSSLTKP